MNVQKTLALLVIWLVVAATPAHAQIERSQHFSEELQHLSMQCVVRISIWTDNGGVGGCGVCIGRDDEYTYILSCAHVVKAAEQAKKTQIDFFTRKSYPNPAYTHTTGFRFWLDRDNDLALIKVAVRGATCMPLCPGDVELPAGLPLLSIGCGNGAPPVAQVGKFVGRDQLNDYVMDRGGIGGRSGGAVISAQGLVGIHARGSNDQSYAVNHQKIHDFIERTGHARYLMKPVAGAGNSQQNPGNVANTTWDGTEDLEGFGKLSFQFHGDGTVTITDAKSTLKGHWAQRGKVIVMELSNCVYVGEINGQLMTGAAQFTRDGELTGEAWRFSVRRQ